MEKYFLHRIQKENGAFTKGIEVHDSLDSAVLSYHGRMKTAYGANPSMTFVSCAITDGNGNIVYPYCETWVKDREQAENKFFMHYIRVDGSVFTKGIDALEYYDAAKASFHAQMEYGYDNPQHQNVSFVSCMITDMLSGEIIKSGTWNKATGQ